MFFSEWYAFIFVGVIILIALPLYFLSRPGPTGPNRFGQTALPMSFTQSIYAFFRNYFNFNGRASRSEFWYATLFLTIVTLPLDFIEGSENVGDVLAIATVIPSLSLTARRLHDINRSGWYQLLFYCAPVGTLWLVHWFCKPPSDTISKSN